MKEFNVSGNGKRLGTISIEPAMGADEIIALIIMGIALVCAFIAGVFNNWIMTVVNTIITAFIVFMTRLFVEPKALADMKGIFKFLIGLAMFLLLCFGVKEIFWDVFSGFGGEYWEWYGVPLSIILSVSGVLVMCRRPRARNG